MHDFNNHQNQHYASSCNEMIKNHLRLNDIKDAMLGEVFVHYWLGQKYGDTCSNCMEVRNKWLTK